MPLVPRVPPFERPASYDDLVKLPDHVVAEIVGGELHASPRPAPPHAVAYIRAAALLVPAFDSGRSGPGGWWILAEPELHLGADVLVPDLAGWRRTRMPQVPDTAYFPLAPDWLCEIISPSTARLDRAQKLAVYAREGVSHAWLLDPLARTLEVLRLAEGRWTIVATHAGADLVRAEPFDAIEFTLSEFWAE
jgi:Uma2 family endonuclease